MDTGYMNEWQCLMAWAIARGLTPNGGENELQLLRMIASTY